MQIIFSELSELQIKKLAKKYKTIISDLDLFFTNIEQDDIDIGKKLQGFNISIYKARVRNSANNKGKSGGFRIIYYFKSDNILYVLAIYSKSEKGNINNKLIMQTLKHLNLL